MENKKYKLDETDTITVNGKTLYRIIALKKIDGVISEGEKGGYIESEDNLAHKGSAWVYKYANVYDDAQVYNDARVSGCAQVYGKAEICGGACVFGDAEIYDNAKVSGYAEIYDNAKVFEYTHVFGYAQVYDNAWVSGTSTVCGHAKIHGDVQAYGYAEVFGYSRVSGNATVCAGARICGNSDYFCAQSFGTVGRTTTFFRTKKGCWIVNCGCFSGSVAKFRKAVVETHEDSLTAQEYLLIADLAELRIKRRAKQLKTK